MPADRAAMPGPKGFLIATPASNAGKTTVTLALLRALRRQGIRAVSAKSGPDYIDPKFHEAATGKPCINLDAWAMSKAQISAMAKSHSTGQDLFVIEGAMGLFDGAANGTGSAADLASILGLPVVLVVDCSRQAQSVAALVHGFQTFRKDVAIAAVILNRTGSSRHEQMLRTALAPLGVPVAGCLPRSDALLLPERHLGLVQAGEHAGLENFLEGAANVIANHVDLHRVRKMAAPLSPSLSPSLPEAALDLPPLGQRIATARDSAFAFSYPHILDGWRAAGAELSFFSPLADEAPDETADAVYLPGGYPELHAGRLAAASAFKAGMRAAQQRGALIYGECGGFMTLGERVIDVGGTAHDMLGLLPLETSFAIRKRHLGYRVLTPLSGAPWNGPLTAHEFHYATIVREGAANRLFSVADAEGNSLGETGLRTGNVMGSFAHVIAGGNPAGVIV